MPTGYTAGVQDGTVTTFEQFAMQCARGFGALVMMRDEPFSAPVPDRFEPRVQYHLDALETAQREKATLAAMSAAEASAAAKATFEQMTEDREGRRRDRREQRGRYEAMLAEVEAWVPPSEDHRPLKEFMVEQIRTSIEHDCSDDIEQYEKPIVRKSGQDWRADRLTDVHREIAYHEKARAEEIERTEDRNRWLQQLRDSLPAAKSGEAA